MKKQSDISDKPLFVPPFTEAFVFERRDDGIYTNVPHIVIQHSPGGYEFGYQGSGPADLALNICETVLMQMGYSGPRVKCWDGQCFEAAYAMHQDAKRLFIASLPRAGGRIEYTEVAEWVLSQLEQVTA